MDNAAISGCAAVQVILDAERTNTDCNFSLYPEDATDVTSDGT